MCGTGRSALENCEVQINLYLEEGKGRVSYSDPDTVKTHPILGHR